MSRKYRYYRLLRALGYSRRTAYLCAAMRFECKEDYERRLRAVARIYNCSAQRGE